MLSSHQINAVRKYIETKTPDELDLPYLFWTREAVQKLIWQKYRIAVALKTLSTWLHNWGFSPQKTAKKAMEQNPELARKWLENEELKKRKQKLIGSMRAEFKVLTIEAEVMLKKEKRHQLR